MTLPGLPVFDFLTLPWYWWVASLLAWPAGQLLHEATHYAAARLVGVTVHEVHLSPAGAMYVAYTATRRWQAAAVDYAPQAVGTALAVGVLAVVGWPAGAWWVPGVLAWLPYTLRGDDGRLHEIRQWWHALAPVERRLLAAASIYLAVPVILLATPYGAMWRVRNYVVAPLLLAAAGSLAYDLNVYKHGPLRSNAILSFNPWQD